MVYVRSLLYIGALFVIAVTCDGAVSYGAIVRWDNGSVIPGTEGSFPKPDTYLPNQDLSYADLRQATLTRSIFDGSNLANADVTGANLNSTSFRQSTLTNARLSDALIENTGFIDVTNRGFTQAQLQSTASYHAKNLHGLRVTQNNLSGWDFSGQDLTSASFELSTLTGTSFSGASVQNASFAGTTSRGFTRGQLEATASYQAHDLRGLGIGVNDLSGWDFRGQNLSGATFTESTLTNTDFTDASVERASFEATTSRGFTESQLQSTASYMAHNLRGIRLDSNVLSGWNFDSTDLSGASFESATLTDAKFANAIIDHASFGNTTSRGFTQSQLQSTASFKARNLRSIRLYGNNLSGWDFSNQDLTDASLYTSTLSDANFTGAIIQRAWLIGATSRGFTEAQLQSTASYQSKNLRGVRFAPIIDRITPDLLCDFSGWDLSGIDFMDADLSFAKLTNANLAGANLTNVRMYRTSLQGADLTGANLKNVQFAEDDRGLQFAKLGPSTVYNQYTVFPDDFDPNAFGLTFVVSPKGDVDFDDHLDADDLDVLSREILSLYGGAWPYSDLNLDGQVTLDDHRFWVKELKQTWYGDANLDGQFDSQDLISVFSAGHYEDTLQDNSGWAQGDWNADADFTSSDLIVAFQDGGYEQGPRDLGAVVPEPSGFILLLVMTVGWCLRGGDRRSIIY